MLFILNVITFRIFFKWSTEISPLENFLLAYAAKVDCSSYMITPRNLEIPKINVRKNVEIDQCSH